MRGVFTRTRWPATLLVVVLLAFGAACGGDDTSDTTDESTSPAAQESTPADQPTDEATDEPSEMDTAGAEGDGQGLASEECVAAAEAMSAAASGMFDPTATDGDPGDAVEALNRMAEVAPADIREDFLILAEALGSYFAALEDAGVDLSDPSTFTDPEAAAAVQAAAEELDTAAVEEASNNIEAWFDNECGDVTP